MSNVWFTSDLHLGHELASEKRGFASVSDHDEFIISTLEKQIHKKDLLYVLGDVVMKHNRLPMLKRIAGRKNLILGNHDQLKMSEYFTVFSKIHGFVKYKNMWISHCPIHPQEMYRCNANIHGHIHKNTNSPELPFPYINMNWDFWSRAVSFHEIQQIIKEGLNDNI